MNILYATSECVPFVKTGGLADVMGALPGEVAREGHDARVILPKYKAIRGEWTNEMVYVTNIVVNMGWRSQYCGVFSYEKGGVTYYFVDNEFYFGHDHIYGEMHEDIERFAFFDRAVLALLPVLGFRPDVIHCNDWQTGMIPVLLKAHYAGDPFFWSIKTVFTIHNLKFQGIWDTETFEDVFSLTPDYFTSDKLAHYGDGNMLKGGVVYADFVTTVSPTYAREIRFPYFGEGLDGLLSARSNCLAGIVNGIDYEEYNPAKDPYLTEPYTAHSFVSRKAANKAALQEEVGLAVNKEKFLVGMVTRLTSQKGLDLLLAVMDDLCRMEDLELLILGTGDAYYENALRGYENRYKGKICAYIQFNNGVAHRIYAGSDAFLMPSVFEPCGLSQLIAMHYGSLPIVRETGGLLDTVDAYNEYENTGTGFRFANINAHEMLHAVEAAERLYTGNRTAWNQMVRRAMAKDFSWTESAKEYIKVYERLLG